MGDISKGGLMVTNQGRSDQHFALGAAATSQESTELWHRRFRYLGYDNLYKLQSKSMVDGISVAAAQFKERLKEACEPASRQSSTGSHF